MDYKIKELANISGVTTRALRYYDQIGLLKPDKILENNYRLYSEENVNTLQQICIYKELGFELSKIKEILESKDFDYIKALTEHLDVLNERKKQIENLILTVDNTIKNLKGEKNMTDNEKFLGLKKQKICENEEKYGDEIREKYGDDVIDKTNKKSLDMSEYEFKNANELEQIILDKLAIALKDGDYKSEKAMEIAELHKRWLLCYWTEDIYSKEAHKSLADGYLNDKRFKEYYEKAGDGATEFLRNAIYFYCQ